VVLSFLRLELAKHKDKSNRIKNSKLGLENQSVYPIHTNFTRLQVYLKII
jgi:hypothetical protein